MTKFSKVFLLFLFVAVSGICRSQSFTAYEFINLAYQNPEKLKDILEKKGYNYTTTETSDMSKNDIYIGRDKDMKVSVITPNFENGENLIMWEFIGSDSLYKDLKQQIISNGYKKLDGEVRDGSKYISTTYQRPGVTITLSCDKRTDNKGVYRLSARYSSLYKVLK